MQILCTLDDCLPWPCCLFWETHTFLLPLLCMSDSAVPLLRVPIHSILRLLVLVLRLPCHRNWPCVRLQWPAVTSPSHAWDLSAPLGLTAAHSRLPSPCFLLRPGGDAPRTQSEPSPHSILHTVHPQLQGQARCCFLCPDRPSRPPAPIPHKNMNKHTLAAAARSSATRRSCRSCRGTGWEAASF